MFAFGQFIAAWWPWLLGACLLLFGVVSNPAGALMVLRWLLKTERGRYVLIAALVVGGLCWLWTARYERGYSAAVADLARKNASATQVAQQQAVKRDEQSGEATDKARGSTASRAAESKERLDRAQGIANAPRPPVPANCPEPDPVLHGELQDGSDRIRATEGRLRGLRPPGN